MEKILKYFKKIQKPKHPKELRQWLSKQNIAGKNFFPLNSRRIEELFKEGFFKGHIDNNSFQLNVGANQMTWQIGPLPETAVELLLASPYRVGIQKECALFQLNVDGVTLFESDQTVGEERRVFTLNDLQNKIQRALKAFPLCDEIHIWHTHPFIEGVAMNKNKVAVKIHPLSPSDIRTCVEVNRQFKLKTTVHAVTKSSSHYSYCSNTWTQD